MVLAKGFAEKDGKPIEGYLSDEESFNGVLFILKEPNADDQKRFWFKDCLAAPDTIMETISKRQFTKYQRTFEMLLTYCGDALKLENSAYANIKSFSGDSRESSDYSHLTDKEKTDRFFSLILKCSPKVVFVCPDLFSALIRQGNISCDASGVSYKKGCIHKRLGRLSNGDVTIYEMYHPSYYGVGYPDV